MQGARGGQWASRGGEGGHHPWPRGRAGATGEATPPRGWCKAVSQGGEGAGRGQAGMEGVGGGTARRCPGRAVPIHPTGGRQARGGRDGGPGKGVWGWRAGGGRGRGPQAAQKGGPPQGHRGGWGGTRGRGAARPRGRGVAVGGLGRANSGRLGMARPRLGRVSPQPTHREAGPGGGAPAAGHPGRQGPETKGGR